MNLNNNKFELKDDGGFASNSRILGAGTTKITPWKSEGDYGVIPAATASYTSPTIFSLPNQNSYATIKVDIHVNTTPNTGDGTGYILGKYIFLAGNAIGVGMYSDKRIAIELIYGVFSSPDLDISGTNVRFKISRIDTTKDAYYTIKYEWSVMDPTLT